MIAVPLRFFRGFESVSMVRSALALVAASLTFTNAALAEERVPCDVASPGGDVKLFTCELESTGTPRAYRFRGDFSGSHDDTRIRLTPTLDGRALECAPGSKTFLEGEDGDVRVECRFSIAGNSGDRPQLRVELRWHHAQLADDGLFRD